MVLGVKLQFFWIFHESDGVCVRLHPPGVDEPRVDTKSVTNTHTQPVRCVFRNKKQNKL